MGQRKGIMDNHDLDIEINYQENITSLSGFVLELRQSASKDDNIYRADKAIKQLVEISLYINKLELDNAYLMAQSALSNVKLKKLLEQCLKN